VGCSFGLYGYILRCQNNIEHNTINRHGVEREQKIQQIKEIRKLDSNSLMKMDESKMLARVNMAKFPQDLQPADKKLLAQVAITYGFDPLMGEITIYQGRPFVSIDGRYRKAQETGLLGGVETRPATKQEKEDWGIPQTDFFFRAEVFVKGAARPFVGWGRVRLSETQGGRGFKPVETNPQRMAEKRAEAQALRKAFSIPLPSAEDIGAVDDDNIYPAPVIEAEIVDMPEGLRAQSQSDKDFDELESASSQAEPVKAEAKPKKSTVKEAAQPMRDASAIKTVNDLYKACNEDFGMQPRDVLDALGLESQSQITDLPGECYTKIKAIKDAEKV
jgi:hypothetical protein